MTKRTYDYNEYLTEHLSDRWPGLSVVAFEDHPDRVAHPDWVSRRYSEARAIKLACWDARAEARLQAKAPRFKQGTRLFRAQPVHSEFVKDLIARLIGGTMSSMDVVDRYYKERGDRRYLDLGHFEMLMTRLDWTEELGVYGFHVK
jgi:hypothetical protein